MNETRLLMRSRFFYNVIRKVDYEGLRHGFGLGTGTVAESWINDAVNFWENQMK